MYTYGHPPPRSTYLITYIHRSYHRWTLYVMYVCKCTNGTLISGAVIVGLEGSNRASKKGAWGWEHCNLGTTTTVSLDEYKMYKMYFCPYFQKLSFFFIAGTELAKFLASPWYSNMFWGSLDKYHWENHGIMYTNRIQWPTLHRSFLPDHSCWGGH